ncbi:hypothetical protein [Enterococcus sp. AZ109]|uniref:hypothetical protein n=1 Tax=Enterococcus sp. AZ109 TaxID=2774634 RepID=UPI003F6883D4
MFLLIWPLAALPALYQNKQQTGTYFVGHSRFFVIKEQHYGNGLNMKNKYASVVNIVLAVWLIIVGLAAG